MKLRIATWNVNSLRTRLEHMSEYLHEDGPDILLMQETKTEDMNFPREVFEDKGYNLAIHGQKTYNGVAIASRLPLEDIRTSLPGETVEQARFIEAVISLPANRTLRVASVYVPNGQAVDSEKFPYKLGFLENLRSHLASLKGQQDMLVYGGDYNVAPFPADVYDPKALDGTVCYHPAERERFRGVLNLGYYDAYRTLRPGGDEFSWWDYRQNSFGRNHGMRIDHLLLCSQAMDHATECTMLRDWRAKEKPSDHIPVVCTLEIQ